MGPRFKDVADHVITLRKLAEFAEHLESGDPEERLYACVQLSMYFRGESRKSIQQKLDKIREQMDDTDIGEAIQEEIASFGERLYDLFTPSEFGKHNVWFWGLFSALIVAIYCYMVADDRNYEKRSFGPSGARDITHASFDTQFLVAWNGFYLPKLRGQPHRWVTSVFLHQSFIHITSNLLMFTAFCTQVERRYGTRRVLVIAIVSGISGNLLTGVFEDVCTVVVGASGMIFGLAGLWVADLIINFHFIKHALLQSLITLVFFAYVIVTLFTQKHVSHYSHIGGFLGGLFPSLLFLPRFGKQRIEVVLPWIGLIISLIIYITCPLVVYLHRLHNIECPATD